MADSVHLHRRGVLFILSSPSGAGKTTISKKMLAADPDIALSISATTRPMRPGERDGVDYHFVDVETFKQMAADGGIPRMGACLRPPLRHAARAGRGPARRGQGRAVRHRLAGAQQLYQEAGPDVVRVFILPPTMAELERRLRSRGTDSDEVIAARMARAANEISHWDGYDYVLINDDVEGCFDEVKAILRAERLKRRRQIGLIGFARDLIRSVPEADKKL